MHTEQCASTASGAVFNTMRRQDTPIDDYDGAADALYRAWWSLFPLRLGLRVRRSIPAKKWRHLFLCTLARERVEPRAKLQPASLALDRLAPALV